MTLLKISFVSPSNHSPVSLTCWGSLSRLQDLGEEFGEEKEPAIHKAHRSVSRPEWGAFREVNKLSGSCSSCLGEKYMGSVWMNASDCTQLHSIRSLASLTVLPDEQVGNPSVSALKTSRFL